MTCSSISNKLSIGNFEDGFKAGIKATSSIIHLFVENLAYFAFSDIFPRRSEIIQLISNFFPSFSDIITLLSFIISLVLMIRVFSNFLKILIFLIKGEVKCSFKIKDPKAAKNTDNVSKTIDKRHNISNSIQFTCSHCAKINVVVIEDEK